MESNRNRLILGGIILLCGLFFILPVPTFRLGSFVWLAGGLALILVYITKRRTVPLIVGGYMTYFGIIQVVGLFYENGFTDSLLRAMFFIVPGIIFMVLYMDKRWHKLLLPSTILIFFGLYTLAWNLPIIGQLPIIWLFLSLAFFAAYIIGRGYTGKWAVKAGTFLFIIFIVLTVFGFIGQFRYIVGTALVVLSAYFIYTAIKKRKR